MQLGWQLLNEAVLNKACLKAESLRPLLTSHTRPEGRAELVDVQLIQGKPTLTETGNAVSVHRLGK